MSNCHTFSFLFSQSQDDGKQPIIQEEHAFKQVKETTLKEYFKNTKEVASRNSAILLALNDGYTQGEVARYLELSTAMVSKVFRGVK